MKRISDEDPGCELDEGDGEPDLDRDRARDEDRAAEDCRKSKIAHRSSFQGAVVSSS